MTLQDYYQSLERPEPPKTSFVRDVAAKCGVDTYTVRLWIKGVNRPLNKEHVKILSIVTGIEEEKLWEKQV